MFLLKSHYEKYNLHTAASGDGLADPSGDGPAASGDGSAASGDFLAPVSVDVIYDRTGRHYGRGKGLQLIIDGKARRIKPKNKL